ncbi:MAG: hypothetical protein ABWY18_14895 [Tardiphaga sp.]
MRLRVAAVVCLAVGLTYSAQAAAAKPPVRSYESCSELADQRGFMANERRGARKRFVRACMRGTQQ